jgi:hypothetical protein
MAGWMQQVVVKVQNTSGSDLNECSFQGLNSPMAITSGGLGFVNQQAVVVPADNKKNRRLELIFSAYHSATGDAEEIEGFMKEQVGEDNYFYSQILRNCSAANLYCGFLGDKLHRKLYSVVISIFIIMKWLTLALAVSHRRRR